MCTCKKWAFWFVFCFFFLFFVFVFLFSFWCNVLKISIKSVLLCHRISVGLLVFYLKDLSFDVGELLKSPTITVFLSVSPFMSVSSCFMYLNMSFGWTYVNKYNILFFNWSFYLYIMSFFIYLYGLCFKVYFVWYEYCYPYFPVISICLKFFFSIPSHSIYMCPLPALGML